MKADLLDDLKKKKPFLGLDIALKKIRNGKTSKAYVSSNSGAKNQLVRLCKTIGVEVILLQESSKDLGIICKKPFSVSVISFE